MLFSQKNTEKLGSVTPGKIDVRSIWTRLHPTRSLDTNNYLSKHILEIVSVCKSQVPGLTINHGHAFIRLIDSDGGVRPVGFFPDESTEIEPEKFPGLRMPGMLLLPDKYDRIDWNPMVTSIAVEKDQFDLICSKIEKMQFLRNNGTLSFDLLDLSCVGFVVRVARMAGIDARAEVSLTDFLENWENTLLKRGLCSLFKVLPKPAYRLLFNMGLIFQGGLCTFNQQWEIADTGQRRLNSINGIKPVFSSWRDIFSQHVPFYHVRALREWQHEVEIYGLKDAILLRGASVGSVAGCKE